MIDPETQACRDGLTTTGVNENQGAESTLSWVLSLLAMHETEATAPSPAAAAGSERIGNSRPERKLLPHG
jgi:hypothetical protein